MLTVSFDATEAQARLHALPALVADALHEKMQALSAALLARVEANVSGALLNVRSGALRAALFAEVETRGDSVSAEVGVGPQIAYAAIQEFGGVTAPHDIVASKARALAFFMGGKRVFARRVHHPGSRIPAHAYLRSALDGFEADMASALVDALRRKVEGP